MRRWRTCGVTALQRGQDRGLENGNPQLPGPGGAINSTGELAHETNRLDARRWLLAGIVEDQVRVAHDFIADPGGLARPVVLPVERAEVGSRARRVSHGIRLYFSTPRLRGLFALNFAVAAASAMVIVNTVIYARESFDLPDSAVAWGLGAAGLGSMIAALVLPFVLRRVLDRTVMLLGSASPPSGFSSRVRYRALRGFSPAGSSSGSVSAWFRPRLGV